jgi:hypothetical protein
MADLAIPYQFWVGRIPGITVGVLAMTLSTLGRHIALKAHVMSVVVSFDVSSILKVPDKISKGIVMVVVSGMFYSAAVKGIAASRCRRRLIPVAVIAVKRRGGDHARRILGKRLKVPDRAHQIGIVTDDAVIRLVPIGRLVMPAVDSECGFIPGVAPDNTLVHYTVSENYNARCFINEVMAGFARASH